MIKNQSIKTALLLILAVFLIILDRLFKILALNVLNKQEIYIVGDLFKLDFVKNYYIAFSLPFSGPILFIIILIAIMAIAYYIIKNWKQKHYILVVGLTYIELGAISNILDRFKHGFVIDYLDLKYFTVFNISDIMIITGAIILIIANKYVLYNKEESNWKILK